MTEQNREHNPNMDADSPELGLSFGILPARIVSEQLSEGLVSRDDVETDDLSLAIRATSELFTQGFDDSIWQYYVKLANLELGRIETENSRQIVGWNDDLQKALAHAATDKVMQQLDYVNDYLRKIPGLIQKSENDERVLRKVAVQWHGFPENRPPKEIPAGLIVYWSDESSEIHQSAEDIFVDTAKLPQAAQDELKLYHQTYEV